MKKNHLDSLVILRGLAALVVCCCHFCKPTSSPENPLWLYEFFGEYGTIGVEVFFVVSGFVIPYSLLVGRYALKADF
ncbi:MAG: acyltransferase family protein, partial [Bacteroidota bacterium]